MAANITPPTLTITRIGGEFAEIGAQIRFALTFSEAVTGVTAANLRLNASATLRGVAITSVTGSGADYVVTVGPATAGYGTVSVDVLASGIADLAGNDLKLTVSYRPTPVVTSNPQQSFVFDVNRDGRDDIVMAQGSSEIHVHLSNEDGSLNAATVYSSPGFNQYIYVIDVNSDASGDIIVSVANGHAILLGRGDGLFSERKFTSLGVSDWIAYGDVNGDGKTDLVANNKDQTTLSITVKNDLEQFEAPLKVDIGLRSRKHVLADINGDGKLDIVALLQSGENAFVVLAGNGDGTFRPPVRTTVSGLADKIFVHDINGDGRSDILIGDTYDFPPGERFVYSYISRSDGTFDVTNIPTIGAFAALIDFNQDGLIDILSGEKVFNEDSKIYLVRGFGDGNFGPPVSILATGGAQFAAVGDFNGDAALDFATIDSNKSEFRTFIATNPSEQTGQVGPETNIDDWLASASTTGKIVPGQSIKGFINGRLDKDRFRADLDAGQTYVFDLQGYKSGSGSLDGLFLELLDSIGNSRSFAFLSPELQERQIVFTPSTSATYFLVARSLPSGEDFGSYRLSATRIATKQADFSDAADIVTLRSPIAAVPVQVWSALGGEDGVTGGKSTSDTINGNAGNDTLSGGDVGLTLAGEGVFQAYQLFGRSPDADGFAYMVKNAGSAIGGVSQSFEGSAEFAAIYNGLNNADFITKLYMTALARTPTATELAGWDARFAGSASRAIIASEFVGLPELETRTQYAQAEFAASLDKTNFGALHRLYATAFGRTPDQGGFSDWTGRRDGGQNIGDVALGFANSDEFGAATKGLTNAQIVTKLYQNALGRAPDAGGLADWVAQLDAGPKTGALLAKVLLGFSESAEFKALQPTAPAAFVSSVLTQWTDVLDGGAGDDVLIGGRGSDTFRFLKGETGSDQIIAFESWDSLAFTNFGYASGATALARMAQVGADVVFADQGSSITFVNTTLATVSAANFIVGEIL